MAPDNPHSPLGRRKRRRRILLWLLGAFFLLAALGIALFLYQDIRSKQRFAGFIDALKQSGEPALLEDIHRAYRAHGGEDNSAALFLEAAALVEGEDSRDAAETEDLPILGTAALPPVGQKLPPEMLARIEAYCKKREGIFPLLAEAAGRKGCAYSVDLRLGFRADVSHLGRLRRLSPCLTLHGVLATEKGDPARAAECVRLALATAGSLKQEPTLLSTVVQCFITQLALRDLERLLSTHALPADAAVRLDGALAAQMDFAPLRRALVTERAVGIFMGQEIVDGRLSITGMAGDRTAPRGKPEPEWWLFLVRTLIREGTMRYAELLTAHIACAEQPAYEGRRQMEEHREAFLREVKTRGGPLWKMKGLLALFLPSIDRVCEAYFRTYARTAAARVALAVEAYRREHGRLPETLDDLTPRFLDAVPDDPFARAKLRYRTVEKGYVVYSVGIDETDDGGIFPATREKPGSLTPDIVFRVAR